MTFDLTPDPKVLIALTHTPLEPLDALCELVDNALDSFESAKLEGSKVDYPLVTIDLPSVSEARSGLGLLRVRDNGSGLAPQAAQKALRAGFSGNNPYDRLGLFGMGFNISTGKLGSVTKFLTRRRGELATEVIVDLNKMQQERTYKVPFAQIPGPAEFQSGTIVEVSQWWPEGNPNRGFIKKLVGYGASKIANELGRRYATILRSDTARILVNGTKCVPFEHCVWDRTRFLERRGIGQIPARFEFNEVIQTQVRCAECTALVLTDSPTCPVCGRASFRTFEERIRGWVGIQRFDDPRDFGIDLIRNGRAIRPFEQAAFFEYTDDLKKTLKDYPVDSPFGRIVGEVHLDHVAVDFLKQDFQRSTEEWRRAMTFLRGESSLQAMQPGADSNHSFVFKLYQGYRKVRTAGRRDMYMGIYDPVRPKRISRDTEREYYAKFLERLDGYYDDAEWWKLVEQADTPPTEAFLTCPQCSADNLPTADRCQICGHVLIGKPCVSCQTLLPKSAVTCSLCGESQIPTVSAPWRCNVCESANTAAGASCNVCGSPKGAEDPLSRAALEQQAQRDDELSIAAAVVMLVDDSISAPLDVNVFAVRQAIAAWKGQPLPLVSFKSTTSVDVFFDPSHRLFRLVEYSPEFAIATEIAQLQYELNRRLSNRPGHSIPTLTWQVLHRYYSERLEVTPERLTEQIDALFEGMRERLPALGKLRAEDWYAELTERQQRALLDNLLAKGHDIAELSKMRDSGAYLRFVDEETVISLFRRDPSIFLDGGFWKTSYSTDIDLPESIILAYQARIRATILNCLEAMVAFQISPTNDILAVRHARASLELLSRDLA